MKTYFMRRILSANTIASYGIGSSYNQDGTGFRFRLKKVLKKHSLEFARRLGWNGLIAIVIIIAFYVYNGIVARPGQVPKDPAAESQLQRLHSETMIKEAAHPEQYLQMQSAMRTNMIGARVFEGTVINTATEAVFKDIQLRIDLLSSSNKVVASQNFLISGVLAPKNAAKFRFKARAPQSVTTYTASITQASIVRNQEP
jgi:hypothetical protein